MERIMIYLVFMYLSCPNKVYTFTAKHAMDKLDYIEERLNAESRRLNAESEFRKKEFNVLFNKLESIEAMLHTIFQRKVTENVKTTISEQTGSLSRQRMGILLNAFKTEKFENKRFKRELLKDFNTQNEQIKEEFERVKDSLGHITIEISQLKEETKKHEADSEIRKENLRQKIEESVQDLKSVLSINKQTVDTILVDLIITREKLEEHVNLQNISQKQCANVPHNLTKEIENLEIIKISDKKKKSCLELFNNGFKSNGIYYLEVNHLRTDKNALNVPVYCDMTTDKGGWTVFQRRKDGSVDFNRDWNEYKNGFGDLNSEFWLGNEYINFLTDDSLTHELRIDLEDHEGNRAYAKYSNFHVGSENTDYQLEVNEYVGNAGDALTDSVNYHVHNGMKFSTKDRDNDKSGGNCALSFNGAWWFNSCFATHLNGIYHNQSTCNVAWHCIVWYNWKGPRYSLKFTEMKLR